MKKQVLFIVFAVGLFSEVAFAQKKYLNIANIHTLVENSKTEYEKQNTARDKAAIVATTETANRTILGRAKVKFVELSDRYSALGMAIDAAQIGVQASPMVTNIIRNQAELIKLCNNVPAISILAYQSEVEFLDRAHRLVNFIVGLGASAGIVNQMKMADRKILLDHLIGELSAIEYKSAKLVNMVRFYNNRDLIRSANPFQNWIDQDKQLVDEILNNYKDLKP